MNLFVNILVLMEELLIVELSQPTLDPWKNGTVDISSTDGESASVSRLKLIPELLRANLPTGSFLLE